MRRRAWLAGIGVALAALAPGRAVGHLFHPTYEPPDNQLTRDARVLLLLVDDPAGSFEAARRVYDGTRRVRLKPGAFRKPLTRPSEPGLVFKAAYQLTRWSGSLETEAERIDRERGTTLARRMDSALAGHDRDGVHAAMRDMFVVLLEELVASVSEHLDQAETAARLYGYAGRYYSVGLEAYVNVRDPGAGTTARTALEAMARALPEPGGGAPASPEAFDQQRRRFLRVIRETAARP